MIFCLFHINLLYLVNITYGRDLFLRIFTKRISIEFLVRCLYDHTMEIPKAPPLKKRIDAITDERIGEAIKANQGLIYLAAQSLGYDGSHFAARVRESEYLQAIVLEAKELRIDAAERSLHHLVAQKKLN